MRPYLGLSLKSVNSVRKDPDLLHKNCEMDIFTIKSEEVDVMLIGLEEILFLLRNIVNKKRVPEENIICLEIIPL
jgi:hypothetical protein